MTNTVREAGCHKSSLGGSLIVLLAIYLGAGESAFSADFHLKVYDSLATQGKVQAGRPLVLGLEVVVDPGDTVYAIQNGFELYSPDGATWWPHLYIDTFDGDWGDRVVDTFVYQGWSDSLNWTEIFDFTSAWTLSDHDGNPQSPPQYGRGIDTICYDGSRSYVGSGLQGPLSFTIGYIVLDSVSNESSGKTICFDTVLFFSPPVYADWFWVLKNDSIVYPTWDGERCFEITSCCQGMRGNVNFDLADNIDISDLTALVSWMFRSNAVPPCMLEADVDGNGSHDIADVTYLVGYMFKGGPEPAGCP